MRRKEGNLAVKISRAVVFFSNLTYKYCPISNCRAVKFHFPSQKTKVI